MKMVLLFGLIILGVTATLIALPAASPALALSPDDAAKILKEGNERYLSGKPQHPRQGAERRALTAGQGQHPLAAVLSCSDSRVPVEIIFDQGLGDIFVVRVAGNVAQADELGSLEYAVEHLAIPLIVVLGHSQCGSVTSAVKNEKVHGNLADLVKAIAPAAAKAKADNPGAGTEALIDAAIKANIWQAVEDLFQKSPEIRAAAKAGKVKVVGALYEIDTGQVQWLGPHPEQNRLLGVGAKPASKGKKGESQRSGK